MSVEGINIILFDREISNLADTRILVERDHKLNNEGGSNGHLDPTRFTVVSA